MVQAAIQFTILFQHQWLGTHR